MAMTKKLADLYVEVRTRGMGRLQAGLVTLRGRLTKTQHSLAGLGRTLMRVARRAFYALTAAILASVYAAAQFQKQMAMVSTMLDTKTMPMLGKMSAQVRKLAVQYGQSTATLSRGLYDILSASIPAAKAMDVLKAAADGATGGVTQTGIVTNAVVKILNSYSLSAERAGDVTDWMQAIVQEGVITYEELASTIGMASASAKMAGLSLNELGAMVSTMTRSGLNAHQAITAVVNIMRGFLLPTSDSKKMAKAFGIELNSTTLKTKGFVSVMRKLQSATAEQVAIMFPSIRGLRGVAAVLGNLTGFEHDLEIQSNRTNLVMEAKAKITGTMAFQFNQLKQEFMAIGVEIGNKLIPEIQNVMPAIKQMARDFRNSIGPIIDKVKELTSGFMALVDIVKKVGDYLPDLGTGYLIKGGQAVMVAGGGRLLSAEERARGRRLGVAQQFGSQINRAKGAGTWQQMNLGEQRRLTLAAQGGKYWTQDEQTQALLERLVIVTEKMERSTGNVERREGPIGK